MYITYSTTIYIAECLLELYSGRVGGGWRRDPACWVQWLAIYIYAFMSTNPQAKYAYGPCTRRTDDMYHMSSTFQYWAWCYWGGSPCSAPFVHIQSSLNISNFGASWLQLTAAGSLPCCQMWNICGMYAQHVQSLQLYISFDTVEHLSWHQTSLRWHSNQQWFSHNRCWWQPCKAHKEYESCHESTFLPWCLN